MSLTRLNAADLALHSPAAGQCADGLAVGHDEAARDNLRLAMLQLGEIEFIAGDHPHISFAPALCQALTETARALAAVHAYSTADSYLDKALHWAQVMSSTDTQAELLCAMAEVSANRADLAEAQEDRDTRRLARDHAREQSFAAARMARQTTDPQWEIRVLLRASDVLDRLGDHDDAVHIQQRAMELMGLQDSDAAAGTAAAPFDPLRLSAPSTLM